MDQPSEKRVVTWRCFFWGGGGEVVVVVVVVLVLVLVLVVVVVVSFFWGGSDFSTWDETQHSGENQCLIFVCMVDPGSQRPEEGYLPELVEFRIIPIT